MLDQTLQHIDDRRRQFEGDLLALLRIPSVSADPAFKGDVRHAAEWLGEQVLRRAVPLPGKMRLRAATARES